PGYAGDDLVELRLAFDGKIANIQDAVLWRLFGGRRIHRRPHLPAVHVRIGVGEPEQRAGVFGLEIDHLPSAAFSTQVADQRGLAELAVQTKIADVAVATRVTKIQATQSFTVKPDHGTKLGLKIKITIWLTRFLFGGSSAQERFDEVAGVIDVPAQHRLERSVGSSFGLERRFVGFGESKHREIGGLDVAVGIHLD